MKFIDKGPEPPELICWKSQANDDWQPTYETLRDPEKTAVLNALLLEQGCLCCYCERRVAVGECHIEHMVPQSRGTVDPLDYANLLCSCQRVFKKAEPLHCGHSKGEWYDAELFVSPLDLNCETRFLFLENGEILPKNDTDRGAAMTIKILGLGIPKLNDMRKSVLEPFLDPALSLAELKQFVTAYLERDTAGRFSQFHVAVRLLFGA